MSDERPSAAELLFDRDQLQARVGALAAEVDAACNPDDPPVLISVLKGSTLFFADLVRAMGRRVELDFMSISSYAEAGPQSGVVRIVKDLDIDIRGRDVIVVEDIVDTGLTLNFLRRTLEEREPTRVRTVTLLDKSARRIVPVPVEWVGFEIPDVFVVGYGLDFQGRYRNVPELLAIKDVARLANHPSLLVEELFGVA